MEPMHSYKNNRLKLLAFVLLYVCIFRQVLYSTCLLDDVNTEISKRLDLLIFPRVTCLIEIKRWLSITSYIELSH